MIIATPIWLPAALFAGLFQAWRTALQQSLRGRLSVSGAGLIRYAYGAPFAILFAAIYLGIRGIAVPHLSAAYLGLAADAGLAQILGTALLILSFGHRGFVVGTAFSKTEALMAALAAAFFFGESLPWLAWIGIGTDVAGILILSLFGKATSARDLAQAAVQPAALCGLGAAAMFALTGLLVKQATGHLALTDEPAAALITLAIVMLMQTAMHGTYVAFREPATVRAMAENWRNSGLVGLLAACGSACWFTGFATAPVALVRVVGQIEVIFTIGFAHLYLKEQLQPHEVAGLVLVALGVVLALLGAGVG